MQGKSISKEDILQVCIPHSEHTVFEFIDAFFEGNLDKAIRTLKSLESFGVNALQLQALLVSYAVKLCLLHIALEEGTAPDKALSDLGINHPFMKLKFKGYMQKYGRKRSAQLIESLYRLDFSVKTSYTEPQEALESFLLAGMVKA
jgi:DNA polymerase III delta subunit